MVIESISADDTRKIAYDLGESAAAGDIFCLSGDLGVGKTVFAKGFAQGLGVAEDVTSPTFTIVNEYLGRLKLYHFDVYRIANSDDMYGTGYEEYFFSDGVCLVEWAETVKDIIPSNAVWIQINKDLSRGENYRKITIEGEIKFR